ncbi:MAG: orc1/cdc6 family replication initiation protein [Phycisphaerales bacterium]|nr:orc1/cdc6 family replication initiation protein [Phycisphaerales bacterium]MCB9855325.1 orc1/cdc6 family replication initiation protein [Phycisphaerales bacterium]MCB9862918.1 orc1/cdc6 family replication initiation protein [Phycisphaerales bacterium]
MKITDYLHEQSRSLEQSSRQIRDFRVFDFNHIPEEPIMRHEVRPVIDAYLRYLKTGIANHLFIFGSRGSGKTLMIKYIQRQLASRRDADILYVNCRQHNTSFKVLARLLGVRPRGCSVDELWHQFSVAYSRRLILVLDEVDLLSDKDRHKDILYLLARSPRNYMVVLLSNHPKFVSKLDESIRSSLQPEMLHFRNYDATEILEILRDRARLGLHQFRETDLAQIAALTARSTNSDVRIAIKTLYYVTIEESPDVAEVFNRARRDLLRDVLNDLNDRNFLILRAAMESPEPFVKEVYARYRRLSRAAQEEPFSYVYFYASLSYLQSIGLILLLATKVGRAYTNRIQLLLDSETLEAANHSRLT